MSKLTQFLEKEEKECDIVMKLYLCMKVHLSEMDWNLIIGIPCHVNSAS